MAPLTSVLFERLSGAEAARVEGESAQAIARYNAAVQEQEARAELMRGQFAQQRQAGEAARQISALRAGFGAAGAVPTEGAPVAALAEQVAESELEQLLIGYEAEVRAGRARTGAKLERIRGRAARQRAESLAFARQVQFGTRIGATLLTGF